MPPLTAPFNFVPLKPTLLSLPLEVRHNIYTILFAPYTTLYVHIEPFHSLYVSLPRHTRSLLTVNRQLRREAYPFFEASLTRMIIHSESCYLVMSTLPVTDVEKEAAMLEEEKEKARLEVGLGEEARGVVSVLEGALNWEGISRRIALENRRVVTDGCLLGWAKGMVAADGRFNA